MLELLNIVRSMVAMMLEITCCPVSFSVVSVAFFFKLFFERDGDEGGEGRQNQRVSHSPDAHNSWKMWGLRKRHWELSLGLDFTSASHGLQQRGAGVRIQGWELNLGVVVWDMGAPAIHGR